MDMIDEYKYGNNYSNLLKVYAGSTPTYSPGTSWRDYGLVGYAGNDTLIGGHGDDSLWGGADNDWLSGGYGFNRLDGGTGNDTADYSFYGKNTTYAPSSGMVVNLATGEAYSRDSHLNVDDTLVSIENVVGTSRADIITGSSANNVLRGGSGNDLIIGGAGHDDLSGDIGADVLTGGTGYDSFNFSSIADSTVAPSSRDTITDFQEDVDQIDLSAIDASTWYSGNQMFHFIGGSGFHGEAGELRYRFSGNDTIVEADTNSNGVADFAILVKGHHFLISDDFVL